MRRQSGTRPGRHEVGKVFGVLQVLDFGHFRSFQGVDFAVNLAQSILIDGPKVLARPSCRRSCAASSHRSSPVGPQSRAAKHVNGRNRRHALRADTDTVDLDIVLGRQLSCLLRRRSRRRSPRRRSDRIAIRDLALLRLNRSTASPSPSPNAVPSSSRRRTISRSLTMLTRLP